MPLSPEESLTLTTLRPGFSMQTFAQEVFQAKSKPESILKSFQNTLDPIVEKNS
jgi:hypothetical protein